MKLRFVIQSFALALALSLSQTAACFGQEEEEAAKSYVGSYFIVGLGVTLGLLAICKSAGRRKEVKKPE